MKDPLVEVAVIVPGAPERVLARVAELVGGRVEMAGERGLVAVQGGWWYRGEYEVAPAGGGTRLTHRVRNVARSGRWAVPLANRLFLGYRARTRRGLAALVAELG